MFEHVDPSTIEDAALRAIVLALMNEVERLSAENTALQEENQRLRDEVQHLKGEQGKPVIRPMTCPPSVSSEQERHVPRPHRKGAKQRHVSIDREEIRRVERQGLPPDAEFKGYVDVVVQDVSFTTDNVLFHKEKFYSPRERKTYIAALPEGYAGQFGPGVVAWIISLYHGSGMSEPKIQDLVQTVGLSISAGEISNMLIKHHEVFHQERQDILRAGLESTSWQHLDSTATRLKGQNYHCHVLCNPFYTAYCTLPSKDRIALICALLGRQTPSFALNDMAVQMLHTTGVPQKWIRAVIALVPWGQEMTEARVNALLETAAPPLPWYIVKMVRDGLALGFYRTQTAVLVPTVLLTDDAAQSNLLAEEWALCWVHEARHYKKLEPRLDYHRHCLAAFSAAFWTFYRRLLAYRAQPTAADATALAAAFDTLFGTPTGYDQLDHRAALTRARKDHLLMVLKHPEIPLHNNPAELGVRQRVRKRDVSLAACTPEGLAGWDTFQTIVETAKKLGVNLTAYLRDRITHRYALPSLASLIAHQSLRAVQPRAA
jgi:hypothetical protein